jgi:hypothetical protein
MKMIEITEGTYHAVATRLRDRIGTAGWFNGTVEGEDILTTVGSEVGSEVWSGVGSEPRIDQTAVEWRLTLTAIIYRRNETLPEGVRRPVSDVVPVWWEFHTVSEQGDVPNDFSFAEFKPYLIDND